jgi:RND family efflux transporter MFP subunit
MVSVSYPVERKVTDYADFTGRTAAVDSVEVRARVDGYLQSINFKEGALVKKGDVLFVIDPRPFVAELNRAKAQLEEAKANYTQSVAQVNEAKAQENRAVAGVYYTERRLARSQQLVLGKTITQEEFDLQKSELDQSQADVQRAKAMVASAQAAIATAKAAIQTAQAAIELAELNLSYTNVSAPVDGRISREIVTVGNLIQAGQNGGGTVLTTIVSVDPIYVYFDVDESTVLRIDQLTREGKAVSTRDGTVPVMLKLADEKEFLRQGTINFVDNQINPKTGTLRIRGVFRNENEFLTPGLFVRVRVPVGGEHPSLLVTERAIDNDQGQKILYVVDETRQVVSRPIVVGALHDGLREISQGLKSGERVVVNGLQRIRLGSAVEPKLVAMPAAAEKSSNGAFRVAQAAR